MSTQDNTYERIIAEYQANLDRLNERIAQLRKSPYEGKKLSTYYQMRADMKKSIREMSRYIKKKE